MAQSKTLNNKELSKLEWAKEHHSLKHFYSRDCSYIWWIARSFQSNAKIFRFFAFEFSIFSSCL